MHARSLAESHPVTAIRQQDQRPTREVIVEEIIAFKNKSTLASTLLQLNEAMQSVEGRIKSHIIKMDSDINKYTFIKINDMVSTAAE